MDRYLSFCTINNSIFHVTNSPNFAKISCILHIDVHGIKPTDNLKFLFRYMGLGEVLPDFIYFWHKDILLSAEGIV